MKSTFKSVKNAMKFLAKHNDKLTFEEREDEIILYRTDVAFHGTVFKVDKITGKVLDLSSKLEEM